MIQNHILLLGIQSDLVVALDTQLCQQRYRVSRLPHPITDMQKVWQLRPDLLIMSLSTANGFDLAPCRYLASTMKKTPIMVIGCDNSQARIDSLNICANDYISIPFDMEDFLALVRARVRRISWEKKRMVLVFETLLLNVQSRDVYYNKQPINLTTKEFELLKYFMAHPEQILTHQQILKAVWPDTLPNQDINLLHVYIRYLRQKLKSAGKFIQTVRSVGYMLTRNAG